MKGRVARVIRLEVARAPIGGAVGWPTLAEWQAARGMTDAEGRRRWPLAWPVIEARRAAAREAEDLAAAKVA